MGKLKRASDVYGSAFAFKLTVERNALANLKREPPLQSNNHGIVKFLNLFFIFLALNLALGKYDKMEFGDFLGKNKVRDVDESVFVKCDKIFQ